MQSRLISFTGFLLAFVVILTACSGNPVINDKKVTVGPIVVECVGVSTQLCLLVKDSTQDHYTLFYDEIVGFDYEPGYVYSLLVNQEEIKDPPADGPSSRYVYMDTLDRQPATSSLNRTFWRLTSFLDRQGDEVEILPDSDITARFSTTQLSGSAGCNSYFTSYTLDGDRIYVGVIGSTEIFCEDPAGLMDQEEDYLANFQLAYFYSVDEDQLVVSNADMEPLLTFQLVDSENLIETTWLLTGYNSGAQGFVPILSGTSINARFSEDGVISGNSGCNQFSAPYQADDEQITIGEPVSTRNFCSTPEGSMVQERRFLEILASADSYQIQENQLIFLSESGDLLLAFISADGESAD